MSEGIYEGELCNRSPAKLARKSVGRVAGDEMAGGCPIGGNSQHGLDLLLALDQQRRHGRRHSDVSEGQAEVLDGRVDRSAGDDAGAVEPDVGRVNQGQIGAHDDDGRAGAALAKGRGGIAVPNLTVKLSEATLLLIVSNDQESDRLAVAALGPKRATSTAA
jgi:hypothetical protein